MRVRTMLVLIVLAASALVLVTGTEPLQAESKQSATRAPSLQTAVFHPGLEFVAELNAWQTVVDAEQVRLVAEQARFDEAMQSLVHDLAVFLESATPPPFPSEDWFWRISLCESGGTNGWRTGYFGIEAGYPIGHLSYEEQLAWARDIYARAGDGAWGCTKTVGPAY
jgi:hypothetical protein